MYVASHYFSRTPIPLAAAGKWELECRVWADFSTDQLRPITSAYARYAPNARFHDPVGIANGLESVVSFTSAPLVPYPCDL